MFDVELLMMNGNATSSPRWRLAATFQTRPPKEEELDEETRPGDI